MQTAKIKIDGIYARRRDKDLVRFKVTEIVSRRTSNSGTAANEIIGFIIEDQKEDTRPTLITFTPDQLLGPYEEQVELRERAMREAAEAKAAAEARQRQMEEDRLMLYAFVGVTPPAKADESNQMFRISYGQLTIGRDGDKALIEAIRATRLQEVA